MLEILYSLAQDNPLLFGVILFNVFVGGYILVYFALYIYKKQHPEIMLNILLWKTYARKNHEYTTVDELYIAVMERLRKSAFSQSRTAQESARETKALPAQARK